MLVTLARYGVQVTNFNIKMNDLLIANSFALR